MTTISDDGLIIDDTSAVSDDYDPDDPDNYQDVDQMVAAVTGDEPEAGEAYSIAEEVDSDEADR